MSEKNGSSLNQAITLAAHARLLMSQGVSLEKALAITCQEVSADLRAACQSITYTATRHCLACEAILAVLAKRTPTAEIRAILLVAIAELLETTEKDYVVVNEAVKAAKNVNPAVAGFVNACLRRLTRERSQLVSKVCRTDEIKLNAPAWWIAKMRASMGRTEADAMMRLTQTRPPLILRVNRRRITVDQWLEKAKKQGVEARALGDDAVVLDTPLPVSAIPGFADGLVSVQDAGAQLAAHILAPQAGERILDACAAPGGKTAHLLELADCDVTALEIDPVRARRIEENLTRLGLSARVVTADAAKTKDWWDGTPFDAVLLDAPCTASGIVRRHPDIVFSRRPQDIRALSLQQKKLLDTLWSLVKVGGKLLYVVCSVFEEEGSKQIENFLSARPDAQLVPPLPGVTPLLRLIPCDRSRNQPPGIYDTHDGFFYALLMKH